jgi:hypothetical protein
MATPAAAARRASASICVTDALRRAIDPSTYAILEGFVQPAMGTR